MNDKMKHQLSCKYLEANLEGSQEPPATRRLEMEFFEKGIKNG